MGKLKQIFAGAMGSNNPIYRTAKPHEMIMASATSAAKMTFYCLLMYVSYAMNLGFGIAVTVTGIIIQAKTIFDGVTDPIVAVVFDRLPMTKHGKIRLFLLAAWGINAISAILIFCVCSGRMSGVPGIVVFVILYALFVIGYTMLSISGSQVIGSALTNDPKQRPFINFFHSVYQYLGPIILNTIVSFAILPRHNDQYDLACLSEIALVGCALAFVFEMITIIGISRIDTPEYLGNLTALGGKQTKVGIKEMVEIFSKNKPMRCYLVTGITDKIASNSSSQTIVTTMMSGILIANYKAATMITNASTIISFLFAFVAGVLLAKYGVKKITSWFSAVNIFISGAMFALCVYLGPTGMNQIGKGGTVMMVYVVFSMAVASTKIILNVAEGMMRTDIVDYELERSGNYMPGTVGAVYSFLEKCIASFGSTIASFAVAAIGYTTVMPQKGDPATWPILWVTMILLYGLPMIGWAFNIVAMRFYELDYDRMVEVQTNIAEKKAAAKAAMKAEAQAPKAESAK